MDEERGDTTSTPLRRARTGSLRGAWREPPHPQTPRSSSAPPAAQENGSSMILLRRTVHLRRPDRARNEGSTGPKRLDDTRCTT